MITHLKKRLLTIAFCLLAPLAAEVAGAAAGPPAFHDDLGGDSLKGAIQRSLEFLRRLAPDRVVGEWPTKVTAQEVEESLLSFSELLPLVDRPDRMAREIRSRFDLWDPSGDQEREGLLVTGYYQPIIEGSVVRTRVFRYPIYAKPRDLIEAELVTLRPQPRAEKVFGRLSGDRLVPYFSRHEIDNLGGLRGKGYEMAWVKDPVDLFFLHVQGSGILRLEDGQRLHVNYAASNGRPYKSIGRILIDQGKMAQEDVSMQRLRRYLTDHPEEREALLAHNERYIFFRFVKSGPLGSLEVPLTPGRSIATDGRLFPKGALAFIVTRKPILDGSGDLAGWAPFSRFVLNQDTGSAIKGPRRVDLYFGSGRDSGLAAGAMRSGGKIYFLLKKKTGG